ncbi:ankyrin repeat-containing domain protein [Flagelloscypha sp. PMI_526]|nr:ankyrin repeat-containing domain protein [Flagelloscypha sp. PMI_526]
MKVPDECFVAYYYFEFTNPSTLSEEALFRSLIFQLSHANYAASRTIYEQHRDGSFQPQLYTLHDYLRELVTGALLPIYIIIDALDELPLPQRKYLVESLLALSSLSANGIHVMATSRDELDIHKAFAEKVSLDFSIEGGMVHNDIVVFVDQEFSAEKWTFWPKQQIDTLTDYLTRFRMVACQVEVLNQTQSTEDMERALASLPATLGDTYLYILNTIPSHLQSRAHTLLCILSTASQLISIAELSALVAVELGDPTDPINLPVYRERMLFHEPQNLIGFGAALVRRTTIQVTWREEFKESLQLSHGSVKEYLLQGTCPWYSLNDQLANETTARACLALLIHNEDPKCISRRLEINYTTHKWRRHILSNHSAQLLSHQKKLFETFPWPRTSAGRWLNDKLWSRETDPFLKSRLVFAAAAGLEQLLFTMLEGSSRWKIEDLNEAMHAASQMKSSAEVFTALIEKGGDVNSIRDDGIPILKLQMRSDRLYIARILVGDGADVNMEGAYHGSALEVAVHQKALDVVTLLVENGANVNMGGGYGSALHAAVAAGALDIARFLVENGADVNMEGGFYGSALQAAAYRKALDVARILVENGADVNMGGGYHGSALHAAAYRKALDVVTFLVEKGAEVNMAGGEYRSALQAAVAAGALDVARFLVENGADVNMVGGYHGSALQAAAGAGALDVAMFLVENGADVNMRGGYHGSVLQAAAKSKALNAVTFLVESGAEVNMAGGEYGSALHAAAYSGALDVVTFLVESGADVNMPGGKYGSVLEAAEHIPFVPGRYTQRKKEVMTFLIAKGAVRSDGTIPTVEELGE